MFRMIEYFFKYLLLRFCIILWNIEVDKMQIIIYLILVLMIVRMFLMSKRTKKSRALINVVNSVGDKDLFYENVSQFEEDMKDDPEFLNKGRVIHLWGMAFHKEYMEFDDVMNSIDVEAMMSKDKNGNMSINENEDAFFYLYLGIPNILEKDDMPLYRRKLKQKMDAYSDELGNHLVKVLADAINLFYENEEDRGLTFYEKVLSGDYGEYAYSKSLIGLYKSIANAHAAVIYKENGETEKYEESVPMLENFAKSGIGERWMQQLGLEVEKPVEEETFDVSNDNTEGDEDKE